MTWKRKSSASLRFTWATGNAYVGHPSTELEIGFESESESEFRIEPEFTEPGGSSSGPGTGRIETGRAVRVQYLMLHPT
ncbi:Hypothetical Protein FCC1311_054472 [Hondaea fermentalgiana]|uniref:Uncharacterized protein n=1 Tax=Hondaea fermentalgiana TaxID=2315210 RepID=A0A2R5GF80_9STRA|nr:Hypothetical Protein FCC1311_054472 [Hondaea fermentalgiana]|eukprot:GBG29225.1 Hypothetical Protein FCC1311_054472 [Hondaea fermentalgiana]